MLKKKYASRSIVGKQRVCKYLSANKTLKRHVPQTVSFSLDHLEMMINKYDMLYVKPDVGSHGIGIFKLKRSDSGYELFEVVKKKQISNHYHSISDVYDRLKKQKSAKLIIQKGISLDTVKGCPYDIRVMVQRKPGGSWVCTGFIVKVGARNKIVTNYYQGGTIHTMIQLGKMQGVSNAATAARVRKMTELALRISGALSKKRSGMHEMGIDFAYDKQNHLWLIEVNSNHPQFHPLKQLDRKAYNKMMHFAASYGRRGAK
ncbi:YheC/YheD family protein [Paenibacillus sp. Soil522]|uniref:YheC/YheD family protein n=1 Tax=Paenibacillus sp. Soil522 TaxID=1736388 RepID=UPI0006FF32C0|nr:YheC/YheD family protein [Paenibacillus sp. Soil522]KRE29764.1 hypothetical protein ASG81_26050 [Paenibacillus sp. Soil522]